MDYCLRCGFWDEDAEQCACPSTDMSFACPIEAAKEKEQ